MSYLGHDNSSFLKFSPFVIFTEICRMYQRKVDVDMLNTVKDTHPERVPEIPGIRISGKKRLLVKKQSMLCYDSKQCDQGPPECGICHNVFKSIRFFRFPGRQKGLPCLRGIS